MATILVASDSFKGSLSSKQIIDIFTEQSKQFDIDIKGVQIADGGEGTIDAILQLPKFKVRHLTCTNPLFDKVDAKYALSDTTAVIEMAEASGLTLIEYHDGNAAITTTYGTGELILDAICQGAKDIYICIGGSATNDGGIGALTALGYKFLDKDGNTLKPIGNSLALIDKIDTSSVPDFNGITFTVVADVDNPLLGENGATRYFGKQKGAVGEIADMLESGMKNYADITEKYLGVHIHDKKSAGAAGGLGAGLIAYLGASVKSGIDTVLDLIDFDSMLDNVCAVITGEGKIDEQSLHGKAIYGVAKRAKAHNIPLYAIAGCTSLKKHDFAQIGLKHIETLSLNAVSVDDSICNAQKYATISANNLLKLISNEI